MEVEIGDVGLEWHAPEILMGTAPSLQNCFFGDGDFSGPAIVDVDFLAVADGDVASFGEFSSTEERIALQGRDNVDGPRWFADSVVQFGDSGGWGCMPIGQSKHFGGALVGGNEGVIGFAGVGSTCCVPCC